MLVGSVSITETERVAMLGERGLRTVVAEVHTEVTSEGYNGWWNRAEVGVVDGVAGPDDAVAHVEHATVAAGFLPVSVGGCDGAGMPVSD
jgi:hypothetical protein